MWGQDDILSQPFPYRWIIPTRVGTSNSFIKSVWQNKDHPHACGDKSLTNSLRSFAMGSSPRVWGQVYRCLVYVFAVGIIPTRVGTRIILISLLVTTKDHPHACGDKTAVSSSFRCFAGSSPRVWGQVRR